MSLDQPIMIRCEGSGSPPAFWQPGTAVGMCSMCGTDLRLTKGLIVEHQRDDILAHLNRADSELEGEGG